MRGVMPARFALLDDVTVGELPYGGQAFAMTIVVPRTASLADLVASLDEATWNRWLAAATDREEVYVELPVQLQYEEISKLRPGARWVRRSNPPRRFSALAGASLHYYVKQNTFLEVDEGGDGGRGRHGRRPAAAACSHSTSSHDRRSWSRSGEAVRHDPLHRRDRGPRSETDRREPGRGWRERRPRNVLAVHRAGCVTCRGARVGRSLPPGSGTHQSPASDVFSRREGTQIVISSSFASWHGSAGALPVMRSS